MALFIMGLLKLATGPDRVVAMFELPLSPFTNRYGSTQRLLAREFGVILIPKKVLARIFTTSGATLDGIHLSDLGHRALAEQVAALLEP